MILVIGHTDSGKSVFAEDLLCKLSGEKPHVYIATMEPYEAEGRRRVEKHRKQRKGKGFITIEKPCLLTELGRELVAGNIQYGLLECVSNLVGNEMHSKSNKELSDDELVSLICNEIAELDSCLKELVAVTNEFDFFEGCDKETGRYIELTRLVNKRLMEISNRYYIKDNNNWICNEQDKL